MIWLVPVAASAGILWWLDRQRRAAAPAPSPPVTVLNPDQVRAMFPPPPYAGDMPLLPASTSNERALSPLLLPAASTSREMVPARSGLPAYASPGYVPLAAEQAYAYAPPEQAYTYAPPEQAYGPEVYGDPYAQQQQQPWPQEPYGFAAQPPYAQQPFGAYAPQEIYGAALGNPYAPQWPDPYGQQQSQWPDPYGQQQQPQWPAAVGMAQQSPAPIATLRAAIDRCPVRPEPRAWDDASMGRFGFAVPRGYPIAVLAFGPVGWAHVLIQHPDDPSPVDGWVETKNLADPAQEQQQQQSQPQQPQPQTQQSQTQQTVPAPGTPARAAYERMAAYMAQHGQRMVVGSGQPSTGADASGRFAGSAAPTSVQGRTSPRMRQQDRRAQKRAAVKASATAR